MPDVRQASHGDVRAVLTWRLVLVEENLMDLAAGVSVLVAITSAAVQQRGAFVGSLGRIVSGRVGRVVVGACSPDRLTEGRVG